MLCAGAVRISAGGEPYTPHCGIPVGRVDAQRFRTDRGTWGGRLRWTPASQHSLCKRRQKVRGGGVERRTGKLASVAQFSVAARSDAYRLFVVGKDIDQIATIEGWKGRDYRDDRAR